MGDLVDVPEGITDIHKALHSYIKQRQDALQVRHIVTAHLNSHLSSGEGFLLPTNLALVESTTEVKEESGFSCTQHEYLRSLRANLNARREFASISTQHHGEPPREPNVTTTTTEASLNVFLDLERQRRRYDRFQVIQNLVDLLAQKPAVASDYFDPRQVGALKDIGSLPRMPSEIIAPSEAHHDAKKTDLKILVDRLEKSVLRANLLLKKEQKLLAKVRAGTSTTNRHPEQENRQQALSTTRNELITWMESELGKAGDASTEPEGEEIDIPEQRGKEYVDSQLASIKRVYAQYLETRKRLIVATNDGHLPPVQNEVELEEPLKSETRDPKNHLNLASSQIYQYLEDLVSISSEQRSIIQQRSYLTNSLTKQIRDAGQDLDRLTDESHLLPLYPMPAVSRDKSKRLGDSASFEEEVSSNGQPSSSDRARAWIFAAESSSIATKEAVLERLEDGESALTDAHETLDDFQNLMGQDEQVSEAGGVDSLKTSSSGGIWALLDGNLGVIRTEESGTE